MQSTANALRVRGVVFTANYRSAFDNVRRASQPARSGIRNLEPAHEFQIPNSRRCADHPLSLVCHRAILHCHAVVAPHGFDHRGSEPQRSEAHAADPNASPVGRHRRPTRPLTKTARKHKPLTSEACVSVRLHERCRRIAAAATRSALCLRDSVVEFRHVRFPNHDSSASNTKGPKKRSHFLIHYVAFLTYLLTPFGPTSAP